MCIRDRYQRRVRGQNPNGMATSPDKVLLPAAVTPSRYEISLDADFSAFTFAGDETITVEVSEATSEISLHVLEISISEASYTPEGGDEAAPELIIFNPKLQTVTFKFENELAVGAGKLRIKFDGLLNNKMAGFYRSNYTDMNGETQIMASTQFEALDARRAFPCWDEPAVKAIFSVELVVPASLVALSNMPELEAGCISPTKRRYKFADTPKMSSYLLAWCVGDFDFLQQQTCRGVVVRVYTPPGCMDQGRFALDVACRSLDFYEDYFGIEYPLAKLDMIAIPEFAAGAMENWGLVTYRTVDLLIDAATASSSQKQRVCSVVTHELAHQWFGNLVTMEWWDDLWLNEGFAAWMQNFAADHLFPEWKLWEQFIHTDQGSALKLDALRSSHPIQVPIKHASEVEQVFDLISYNKGASVIRMIHAMLGPEPFQKGLSAYLKKHAYSNTATSDLWAAWDEAQKDAAGDAEVPVTVSEAMSGWTTQMGFPLISVKEEDPMQGKVTLEQSWFIADGSDKTEEEAAKLWCFPLFVATAEGVQTVYFKEKTLTIDVPPGSWYKLNAGQHVPCRAFYAPGQLQLLKSAVQSKALSAEDRVGLLSDCMACSKAGMLDLGDLMELLAEFSEEENYTVWATIESQLMGLTPLLQNAQYSQYPGFANFVRALTGPAAQKYGWDQKPDEGHVDKMLRALLIRLQAKFPSPEIFQEAAKRFGAFVADPSYPGLPAEYRVPVYSIMLRESGPQAGQKVFADLMTIFKRSSTHPERLQVLKSLGYGASKELKDRALGFAVSADVKLQDIMYAIYSVSGSGPAGAQLCWTWFRTNFEDLKLRASASMGIMGHVVRACTDMFVSNERAGEVEAFFKEHPLPACERKIAQVLEGIRSNSSFVEAMMGGKLSQDGFFDLLVGLYLDKATTRERAESAHNEMDDLLG
eukprot:TRINITY_DN390_c0_g1_i1.p1 TRINITY_DN390_c0_g1~~TRINITY_DN390_c0_g1_i1.p1  ORF type:complete len:926 (-),score=306.71 TRINITY_DN390_c0_g1_i1:329-3106(-)